MHFAAAAEVRNDCQRHWAQAKNPEDDRAARDFGMVGAEQFETDKNFATVKFNDAGG